MSKEVKKVKTRLDRIITLGRVDLYKPIQIAEVLNQMRRNEGILPLKKETYLNPSIRWRNDVTRRLTGKIMTSSAQYQHNLWQDNALPPAMLEILDKENKRTAGAVERYIYLNYGERLGTVAALLAVVDGATPKTFQLSSFLDLFISEKGLSRSVDKAYEIVAYSLFETIVTGIKATIKVSAPAESREMLKEFSGLTKVLLGLDDKSLSWEQAAHIFRVGVTNAADRGLDMWANFGPAVQVKHLTLNEKLANTVVDQVESDHIVIVCKDADEAVIKIVVNQTGWGRRVRGIVKESDLVEWYERCLRGKFKRELGPPLLERLVSGFKAEFPQSSALAGFLEERNYMNFKVSELWKTKTDEALEQLIA